MPQTISMEGLDLRIDGPTLEVRTHGIHKADNAKEGTRLFTLVRTPDIKAILFDGRDAIYDLNQIELLERARLAARLCRGRIVAYAARPEQDNQAKQAILAHQEQDSPCRVFRSAREARSWLKDMLSSIKDSELIPD